MTDHQFSCSIVHLCSYPVLVLLINSFPFSFISVCLMVSSSNIPSYSKNSFLQVFWYFLHGGIILLSLFLYFPRLITSLALFPIPNSIPVSWLEILIFWIWLSNYFPFWENILRSSIYMSWFNISYDLAKF